LPNKPKELYYLGNTELLSKTKVSIVGSRRPNSYTKKITHYLANELSKRDVVVVSGGAMGVDIIAHKASINHTIAIMPCSLDIFYPHINAPTLKTIYQNALALSEFEKNYKPFPYTFIQRNRLVVALGEVLIITQADLKSGSLRSLEIALELGKKVYVLPHRIGESEGTNLYLKQNKVEAIYDIDAFLDSFGEISIKDEFLQYCLLNPSYDEAIKKFGDKVLEAEIDGKIEIKNGRVFLL